MKNIRMNRKQDGSIRLTVDLTQKINGIHPCLVSHNGSKLFTVFQDVNEKTGKPFFSKDTKESVFISADSLKSVSMGRAIRLIQELSINTHIDGMLESVQSLFSDSVASIGLSNEFLSVSFSDM